MPRGLLFLASGIVLAIPTLASGTTQIILHAISHEDRVHCFTPHDQGYRNAATQTITSVAAHHDIDVYLYLYGYDQVEALAFQLVWPADWEYYGWSSDCLGHQLTLTKFTGSSIHIASAFDAITGGALAPVGFASFTTRDAGEVRLEETPWGCGAEPGMCYVSHGTIYPLGPEATGRVAVGGQGYNPAVPAGTEPVEASTWGSLKARYR